MTSAAVPTSRPEMAQRVFPTARALNSSTRRSGNHIATRRAGRIGSMSVSAAAVGARMVPFAIGEQTMGSNLRPAAFCGVSALKPTYGRVSRFGCYPFSWSFDHVGIIGLSMEDLALVLSVIAGPDPRDPSTYTEAPDPATNPVRPANLIPSTYYFQARRVRSWLAMRIQPIFNNYDAFLMPTAPGPAPRGLESTGGAILLQPWSFLGFPAISISGGLSPEGLPLGLQLVGARKADYHLLRSGAWCEKVLGKLPAPPLTA